MNSISKLKQGFTLVELLVVVAMLAILMGSMTMSVNGARKKARIQKATTEVKVITQTLLAYENFTKSGLPTLNDVPANEENLGFLLGEGGDAQENGQNLVLLQAALRKGAIVDPWGNPYRVRITPGTIHVPSAMGQLQTGFYLPNLDRISEEEK